MQFEEAKKGSIGNRMARAEVVARKRHPILMHHLNVHQQFKEFTL
jgi:hypothetical protein